jgi:electron transfer flavoprotein beta subunit
VTKGLVEEKGPIFPYERNYDRKNKTLTVLEPVDAAVNTKAIKFEKPAPNQQ